MGLWVSNSRHNIQHTPVKSYKKSAETLGCTHAPGN
uniref:Uncharacterized protein n=1 Tax=Anguilla anguilla TaxID=7936 RepID=A0A0E9PZZ6_ANGAN